MVFPAKRIIIPNLVVQSEHSTILEGLDVWLRLGLLSDETVRQLCQEHLTCLLSESVAAQSPDGNTEEQLVPLGVTSTSAKHSPRLITRGVQSFVAEVSVIWLLLLGVFMVVVSSGVLAATQWHNFPPIGQYGILFAYTLAFWAASIWTEQQPRLRLTSQMLQVTTLLIIPVNFWMMDGLYLWLSAWGCFMAAIAALVLTGITLQWLRPELVNELQRTEHSGQGTRGRILLPLGTAIALSWLHWGWGQTGFPLVATYVGTIGATIALVYQEQRVRSREPETEAHRVQLENAELVDPPSSIPFPLSPRSLSTITIAIAALLLIARAVLAAGVPINRLGLAVGICGWLLCWLGRRNHNRVNWQRGGTSLLLVGWSISMAVTPPWQAISISGLGVWLLGERLWRTGRVQFLTAGWLVGLQAVWLLWLFVPPNWQQRIIAAIIRLAGSEAMPIALLGFWFFPYLVLTVWLAFRLRHWQKTDLAKHAEWLALGLGIVLTAVSFGNELTRSLNLTFSTLTLICILRERTRPTLPLVYLTHGTALAAIAAIINWRFPNLSLALWSTILIIGMIVEWGFSIKLPPPPAHQFSLPAFRLPTLDSQLHPDQLWQQSTWHFGFVLAGISYLLLRRAFLVDATVWSGMWLATPILLTIFGSRKHLLQHKFASWLSLLALLLVQVLMFNTAPERLISLGTACVLAFINTNQLRQLLAAVVTVGFGWVFIVIASREVFTASFTASFTVNLLAITALLLWLVWGWLQQRRAVLATLYQQAVNGWAIVVTSLTLFFLTFCHLGIYSQWDAPKGQYLFAAIVLLSATGYRTWKRPWNEGFYAIAWSLELVITGIVALLGRSLDAVAITNLALGLGTQLIGDWWMVNRGVRIGEWRVERGDAEDKDRAAKPDHLSSHDETAASYILHPSSFRDYPSSWHVIPLFYALFGLLLQHRSFTATTGLYTLAVVIVGLGVGRRQPFRPLVYLSVWGGSIAAYELLIYQQLQAKGGITGDGLVLMAALAAAIAIVVRFLQRWLISYLRLSVREVAAIAHLHWGLGSALMSFALINSLSGSGEWLWAGIAGILAAYALAMGNERWQGREKSGVRSQELALLAPQAKQESITLEGIRNQVMETQIHLSFPRSLLPDSPSPFLTWTYAGIIEVIAVLTQLFHRFLPDSLLLMWGGMIAASIAFVLYQFPWQRWGWQPQPWRRSIAILPIAATILTISSIPVQGLLIVAAFYAWLAKVVWQVRLSYISVLIADWAGWRWLHDFGANEPLWYAALISISMLYLAQVDPGLQSASNRNKRHLLRSLATGLVCLTAFYQAEIGIQGAPLLLPGFLSIGLQLGFILAGLLLRIRAFLFVGTAVFMVQVLRQLWRFIGDYSLLLWALGIILGLGFIWIAATFEARRSQIAALLQYWVTELEAWE